MTRAAAGAAVVEIAAERTVQAFFQAPKFMDYIEYSMNMKGA
jgi:hypothetical protein